MPPRLIYHGAARVGDGLVPPAGIVVKNETMLDLAIEIVEAVSEADKLQKPLVVDEHAAVLAKRHARENVTVRQIADAMRQEMEHCPASIL